MCRLSIVSRSPHDRKNHRQRSLPFFSRAITNHPASQMNNSSCVCSSSIYTYSTCSSNALALLHAQRDIARPLDGVCAVIRYLTSIHTSEYKRGTTTQRLPKSAMRVPPCDAKSASIKKERQTIQYDHGITCNDTKNNQKVTFKPCWVLLILTYCSSVVVILCKWPKST